MSKNTCFSSVECTCIMQIWAECSYMCTVLPMLSKHYKKGEKGTHKMILYNGVMIFHIARTSTCSTDYHVRNESPVPLLYDDSCEILEFITNKSNWQHLNIDIGPQRVRKGNMKTPNNTRQTFEFISKGFLQRIRQRIPLRIRQRIICFCMESQHSQCAIQHQSGENVAIYICNQW